MLATLVGGAIVVLGVVGWRRWHSPDVFAPAGGARVWVPDAQLGEEFDVGMSDVERSTGPRDAQIDTTRPNIVTNTAEASISMWICDVDRRRGVDEIESTRDEPLATWCTRLVPAAHARMRVAGRGPEQLVMTVVPEQPGVVVVRGVDVTYSYGLKHGTQRIGDCLSLTVPSVTVTG